MTLNTDETVVLAPAQVVLRWITQRGIAVIPKSNNQKRFVENLECESFNLDAADMKALSSLNMNLRV